MKQYITRKEAARLLNCTTRTVDRYAARGIMRKVMVAGGKYAKGFLLADVEGILQIVPRPEADMPF